MKAYKSKNGILREIWGAQSLESKARCAMIVRLQIMKGGLQLFSMYAIVQKEEFSMKNGMKRLVSGLLAIAMVLTTFGVNTKTVSAEERTMQSYVYDGYEVDFNVTDAWDGAFNAEVKLVNTGDVEICDWALTFEFAHEIQNLWNATVVEHTGNTYVIKNADWNANIKPGEGVAFGMTVLCDGDIAFPEKFSFVMEEGYVTAQDYSAEFMLYSDWGTGCNGAIILSNLTNEPIENWQLEFDYDREIVDIANAVIVSHEQDHYVIENAGYNADIAANSSVHISIVAGEGATDEKPENFTMQQTVVGDASNGAEDEKDPVIAERLTGVKYKEPGAEHMQYDEASNTYYVDNQLALIVKDGVTKEQVENYAKELEASVVGYIVVTGDYQLEFATAKSWEELHALMEKIAGYDWVEEVLLQELYEIDICASLDDPAWYVSDNTQDAWMNEWDENFPAGNNWGLEAINARGAWEYEGETVKVGIIDTMFDTEHEDLKDIFEEVWENKPSSGIIWQYQMYWGSDSERGEAILTSTTHGTHTAGTLAACVNNGVGISGVANNVKLYGVSTDGTLDGTTEAKRHTTLKFKYAIAKLVLCDCRVINISMGSPLEDSDKVAKMSQDYEVFLKKLLNIGYDFLIVQAAGNKSKDAYYAGLVAGIADETVREHIIIVGGIGLNMPTSDKYFGKDMYQSNGYLFSGYHYGKKFNYGDLIDICAPGEKIFSTLPGNKYSDISNVKNSGSSNEKVEYWEGTSMAAPHVSGVAAMCFSVNPDLTGPQVKEIICNSYSQYIFDYRHDNKYKLIDAEAAVKLAKATEGEKVEYTERLYGILEGRILLRDGFNPPFKLTDSQSSASNTEKGFVYVHEVDSQGQRIVGKSAIVSSLGEEGEYELFLPAGEYHAIAYFPGYIPYEVQIEVAEEEVYLLDFVLSKSSETEVEKSVFGTITDAVTGKTVSGVSVEVIEGIRYDRTYEGKLKVVDSDKTDENGRYSVSLMPGYYILRISKDGYVTNYVEIVSADGVENQDAVISTVLNEDEYRIVLTWGMSPHDLDSHLEATRQGQKLFHVYWAEKTYYEGDELIAQLDIDDIDGEGPETVTVTVSVDMETKYLYYIYNYSNRYNSNSNALSFSGAKVDVYCGDKLVKAYSVPTDKTGITWDVFEIFNGEVIDVNQIK